MLRRLASAVLGCAPFFAHSVEAAPTYPVIPAFGGLSFEAPVQVVFSPNENTRAFVVELPGRIVSVPNLSNPTRKVILDLSSRVQQGTPDHGLLSMACHPKFAENGYFYIWTSIWESGSRFLRLMRFTCSPNGTVDPASESTLISQPVGPGGHDGGTLLFGPDGYLYLSIGDGDEGQAGAEAVASHQRIDRGLFGGILRIDVDQGAGNLAPSAHPGGVANGYRVPADNPFVGATEFNGQTVDPSEVRTEFWAVGMRNPFRMAFDSSSGELWVADVGLDAREEIDVVIRGGNYGWNFFEGTASGPAFASKPAGSRFIDPTWDYGHAAGDVCITGGPICRGSRFAELEGNYLFADFASGRIWAAKDVATPALPAAQIKQIASETGIVGITVQPGTGDILLANISKGLIERLGDPSAGSVPPVIVAQPLSQTVGTGAGLGLHVDATAIPTPTYQWYLNGMEIQGATSSDYFVQSTTTGNAGVYTCLVANAHGSILSAPATVSIVAASDSRRLVNISTRGAVGVGDNILIAGFVLDGALSKTVLIRAAGPALHSVIPNGTLSDPELRVFNAAGTLVASNRGWAGNGDVAGAAAKLGAFPWSDPAGKDSALLITLPPGAYSAQVSGASGDTGIALVEVYDDP